MRDRSVLAVFAGVVLIGGSNFVAVRFSNQELAPFWGAALRFALAGALFFAIAAAGRRPLPRGAALVGALAYGLPNFGFSYAFLYWGLQSAPAALGSVAVGLVPLLALLLAAAFGLERLRLRSVAGALLSIVGMAIVFRDQLSAAVPLGSILALLGGALSIAVAIIAAKRLPRSDPFTTNAVGIVPGVAFLLALSALTGERWSLPAHPPAQIAFVYLATIGTIGLFAGALYVLRRWTASATAYGTALAPIITTAEASAIAGELVSLTFIAGAALVLAGVYIGALRQAAQPLVAPHPA